MSNLRKLVGTRIKELRKAKNLKQSELAELVGIETTSICKIESGNHFPKEDNLEKIAEALDVEIKDLFAFSHLQDRKVLLSEIMSLLDSTSDNNIKLAHRIIHDIVR